MSAQAIERLSPFVTWDVAEPEPALEPLIAQQRPSLVRELFTAPGAIIARLEGAQARALVRAALALLVTSSGFCGALLSRAMHESMLRAALLIPVSLLVAIAAALGPIAAVAIVLGIRVPWDRLVGTLTVAMAAGALASSALTPFAIVLQRLDPVWAGPVSVVCSFTLAGVIAGKVTRDLLLGLARAETLEHLEKERVKQLARTATMVVGFTVTLAIWSLHALG